MRSPSHQSPHPGYKLFYLLIHLWMFSPRVGRGRLPTGNWLSQLSPESGFWQLSAAPGSGIWLLRHVANRTKSPRVQGREFDSGFHENVKIPWVCPPPPTLGLNIDRCIRSQKQWCQWSVIFIVWSQVQTNRLSLALRGVNKLGRTRKTAEKRWRQWKPFKIPLKKEYGQE